MRRRCLLVDTINVAAFQGMEAVLLRCPKFFARENLAIVFPEAERCVKSLQAADAAADVNYYLLYTFQPSDYVQDDDDTVHAAASQPQNFPRDKEAATPAVSPSPSPDDPPARNAEDDFSDLIKYSPTSREWKDRSRDRFCEFMTSVQAQLEARLGKANEASSTFFVDWPDSETGLPMRTARGSSTFCDADVVQQFFSFNSVLISGPGGGCRMMEHPRLGLNVYPAAGVLVAPRSAEELLCETVRLLAA